MSKKRFVYSLWDGPEFCGAFATQAEAVADRSDMVDPGQDYIGRIRIFRTAVTIKELEAMCDDDCSALFAKLKEIA